jgi:hypothetical protein
MLPGCRVPFVYLVKLVQSCELKFLTQEVVGQGNRIKLKTAWSGFYAPMATGRHPWLARLIQLIDSQLISSQWLEKLWDLPWNMHKPGHGHCHPMETSPQ